MYNNFMFKKINRKGFTVIEVLVAVTIGAIIVTLSFVNASKMRMRTRDKVRVADIHTIRLALEEYKLHCGEYPARIEPDVHNGCRNGEQLSDYLVQIPVSPSYTTGDLSGSHGRYYDSQISEDNTYFYAGLSTHSGGKCYDYHIGAELEQNEQNNGSRSKYLNQDHDAPSNSGKYRYVCTGSHQDPGDSSDVEEDDQMGFYDFRSKASF